MTTLTWTTGFLRWCRPIFSNGPTALPPPGSNSASLQQAAARQWHVAKLELQQVFAGAPFAGRGSRLSSKSACLTTSDVQAPTDGSAISVAELVRSNPCSISDAVCGARKGIAVIGVNDADGRWSYSLDQGRTWQPLRAGLHAAVLLKADEQALIRFTPKAGSDAAAASGLIFRAWNGTVGRHGGTIDLRKTKTADAFSAASTYVKINVAVADVQSTEKQLVDGNRAEAN